MGACAQSGGGRDREIARLDLAPRASRVGTPMSAFGHVPSVYYRVDCSLKDRSTQQVVHEHLRVSRRARGV